MREEEEREQKEEKRRRVKEEVEEEEEEYDNDFSSLSTLFLNNDYHLLPFTFVDISSISSPTPSLTCHAYALKHTLTAHDLTGQVVWPASDIFIQWLIAPYDTQGWMYYRGENINEMMNRRAEESGVEEREGEEKQRKHRFERFFTPDSKHEHNNCSCWNHNNNLTLRTLHSLSNTNTSNHISATSSTYPLCSLCTTSCTSYLYTNGCHFFHSHSVYEVGSGFGLLSSISTLFSNIQSMSDHQEEIIKLLERNRERVMERKQEEQRMRTEEHVTRTIKAEQILIDKLEWSLDAVIPRCPNSSVSFSPSSPSDQFTLIIGSDVVYDGSSIPLLFSMLHRHFTSLPHSLFLLSYISRWRTVDTTLIEYLHKYHFSVVNVPLDSFMPQPMQEKHMNGKNDDNMEGS